MNQVCQNKNECIYQHLENDIHKFVLCSTSRDAINEQLATLERLYAETPSNALLRVMIDVRPQEWFPLNYTFQSVRRLNQRYTERPRVRFAFMHTEGELFPQAQSFFNLLSPDDSGRFFVGDRDEEALAWLLANAEPATGSPG